MRALIHLAAVLALAAVAIAFGRWLRDPEPGGPLLVLAAAAALCGLALRRLYRPGGLGREPPVAVAAPPPPADDRLDLNRASVAELRGLPGIGPVGAGRIVEGEREQRLVEDVAVRHLEHDVDLRAVIDLVQRGVELGLGP